MILNAASIVFVLSFVCSKCSSVATAADHLTDDPPPADAVDRLVEREEDSKESTRQNLQEFADGLAVRCRPVLVGSRRSWSRCSWCSCSCLWCSHRLCCRLPSAAANLVSPICGCALGSEPQDRRAAEDRSKCRSSGEQSGWKRHYMYQGVCILMLLSAGTAGSLGSLQALGAPCRRDNAARRSAGRGKKPPCWRVSLLLRSSALPWLCCCAPGGLAFPTFQLPP